MTLQYGHEIRTMTLESNQRWRQIGWIDNKQNFYFLERDREKLDIAKPAWFVAVYQLVDNEPVYRVEE